MEVALTLEPKPEELRHQLFVFGESDHAVANIARRHHAEILAQAAGTAAIIGYGHDNGEVGRAILQPAQKRGQTGPASNRKNSGIRKLQGLLVRRSYQILKRLFLGENCEVIILQRLKAVLGPMMNGLLEVTQCLITIPLESVRRSHGIEDVIRLRSKLQCGLQMFHGSVEVSPVHQ